METIDNKIDEVKIGLALLPYFSQCFGRAFKFREKTSDKKTKISPAVILQGNDLNIIRPNDKQSGVAFFYVKSPANYQNYTPASNNEMKFTVDLVMWFNSTMIAGWEGLESALQEIKALISSYPAFSMVQITYEAEQIYDGFTLEEVEKQYFCHPYYGAKITFNVNFFENACQ